MTLGPTLRALISDGRTVPRCETLASGVAIDALAEEHGVPREAKDDWVRLSRTQRLDCLATQILTNDLGRKIAALRPQRRRRPGESDAAAARRYKTALAEVRGSFLTAWQLYSRRKREYPLPDLDFLDRAFRDTDWRLHEGGWYGNAPRVIGEVLPAMYDGVVRSRKDFWVGVMWSPPMGTK